MFRVFSICFCLSVALFAKLGANDDLPQSKVNANDQPTAVRAEGDIDSLAGKIDNSLKIFSAADGPRNDFLKMVMDWRTSDGKPLLLTSKKKLDEATREDTSKKSNDSDRAEVQRTITKELCDGLRSNIICDQETLGFAKIVEVKKANPFDYTVIFKILAESIGLNVDVVEYINGPATDLNTMYPHLCCMVFLDGGKVVLVNLDDYSIGSPFVLSQTYEKNEYCWRPLKNEKEHRGTLFFLSKPCLGEFISFENAIVDKGDLDLSIQDIKKFVESYPNSTLGYLFLADLLYQAKENNRALETLSEAIRIYPEFDIAYYKRSDIYWKMDDYQRSLNELDKAIEVNPKVYRNFVLRAQMHIKLEQLSESVLDLTSAIQVSSKNSELYLLRGGIYLTIKQFDNALADFTKSIELDPNSLYAYAYRAKTEYNLGRVKEAEADVRKARELNEAQEKKSGERVE